MAPAARPAATGGAYRSLAATYAPPVDDGVYSRLARPVPSANPRAASYRAALAENDAAAGETLAPARPANAAASERGGLAAPSASSTGILDIRLTATASRTRAGPPPTAAAAPPVNDPDPDLRRFDEASSLSREDHDDYLALLARRRAREKLSGPDGIRFKALQRRVATEQSVFRNHRWKSALGETPSRYAKVADGADLSVAYRLGARKKIILAHYPPEYTRLRRPPVRAAPAPGTGGQTLVHRGTLLAPPASLRVWRLPPPEQLSGTPRPLVEERAVVSGDSGGGTAGGGGAGAAGKAPPLSGDSNALSLARDHGIRIVATSSALTALAEAVLTRGTDLAIPVVVRELPAATAGGAAADGGATLTHAFLDKPLVKETYAARLKNEMHFAKVLRRQLDSAAAAAPPSRHPTPERTDDAAADGAAGGGGGGRAYTYERFTVSGLSLLVRCKHDALLTPLAAAAAAGSRRRRAAAVLAEGERRVLVPWRVGRLGGEARRRARAAVDAIGAAAGGGGARVPRRDADAAGAAADAADVGEMRGELERGDRGGGGGGGGRSGGGGGGGGPGGAAAAAAAAAAGGGLTRSGCSAACTWC